MDIKKLIDDKVKKRVHMNAAAGLIVKEGENGEKLLLLIQRASDDHWPNHWEFPRGKCDKGPQEDLISCLKREVKEETGLDIIPKFKIDDFQYLADKGTRLTTCHNFYCELKDPDQPVKLSNEHKRYKWVQSMGEVEMLVFPDQKRTADKVLNKDSTIVSYPENDFTVNNRIEEYLNYLQESLSRGIMDQLLSKYAVEEIPEREIVKAEKVLGTKFHPDYREIVKKFGFLDEKNLVLSGLGALEQFENVVVLNHSVLRDKKPLPKGMIAISYENKLDKILLLDNKTGKIYASDYHLKSIRPAFKDMDELLRRML